MHTVSNFVNNSFFFFLKKKKEKKEKERKKKSNNIKRKKKKNICFLLSFGCVDILFSVLQAWVRMSAELNR
jgi:hypothetical protein